MRCLYQQKKDRWPKQRRWHPNQQPQSPPVMNYKRGDKDQQPSNAEYDCSEH
jgi:hypothetical protein